MTLATAAVPSTAHMSEASARSLTDEIRETLTVAYDKLVDAWRGRADLALGYESWDAYCAAEFTEARMLRPTHEQRLEIVATMRSEGMSTRAIASALGVGHKTVARDIKSSPVSDDTPAPVTGIDGKTYTQPESEPETVEAEIVDDPKPRATPRRALTDQFFDAAHDLTKIVDRIERLAHDDRFTRNADQVAVKHRSDLTRAADVLADVLRRLPN